MSVHVLALIYTLWLFPLAEEATESCWVLMATWKIFLMQKLNSYMHVWGYVL